MMRCETGRNGFIGKTGKMSYASMVLAEASKHTERANRAMHGVATIGVACPAATVASRVFSTREGVTCVAGR
jgi:hypothetical protein